MSQSPEHSQPEPPEHLPSQLARDLGSLYSEGPPIPSAVDGAIRFAVRGQFAKQFVHRRRMTLVLRWGGVAAAVAAVLLIGIRLMPSNPSDRSTGHIALKSNEKEDLNGDGRVDILDAFLLARQLKSGQAIDPKWDINGDGVINQLDVDAIGNKAVSLTRRPVQ